MRLKAPFRCINHSCEPNSYVRTVEGVRRAFVMRDIKKGEELTYDYSINGYNNGTFECHCGAKSCRKRYHGNFFKLPRGLQLKYLPYPC